MRGARRAGALPREPERSILLLEYAPRIMKPRKRKSLSPDQLSEVSRLFAALSKPGRLALLQALQQGPLNVGELMEQCGMKQANVSKQLATLRDHRLVKSERRGTTVRYEIADPIVFSLCDLVCGKMQRDADRAAALFRGET